MSGKNRSELAYEVLLPNKGKVVFLESLKNLIRRKLTSNETSVIEYLYLMRSNNWIREVCVHSGIYKWEILPNQEQAEFELI